METVGRYEILREIGRGAMGIVYRALDTTLERDVALKEMVPPPGLSDVESHEMGERFMREARAAARLSHPNIVAVYDTFSEGGRSFIAMELLEGVPLNEAIDRGGLSTSAAVQVILQVLEGVAVAHEAGIIHRDLKPDNIFLSSDGLVKITDFGIAKLATTATAMTQMGTVMGTPGYMSPEQFTGEELDHRTDIFAIGVLLYETVQGRHPFGAGTGVATTALMYRIVHEDVPPVDAAGTPGHIGAIVRKAMSKSPADRYNSAREMISDLRGGTVPARDPQSISSAGTAQPVERRIPSIVWIASVLGVLAVVAFILASGAPGSRGSSLTSPEAMPTATSGGASEPVTVEVTSPAYGVEVTAGDEVAVRVGISGSDVEFVELWIDGNRYGTPRATGPYVWTWIPQTGSHRIEARVTDVAGHETTSRSVSVNCQAAAAAEPPIPTPPFWAAFLFASRNLAESEAKAREAESRGFEVMILNTLDYSTIGQPGEEWWCVCTAPHSSEAMAETSVDELAAAGYSTAYSKLVDY